MMSETVIFDMMRLGLWTAVQVSLPILAVALITGLVVGLLQALTSIQEMTLTFVPKVLAIVITFWMSMDFMTSSLVNLFQNEIIPIVARYH
ncbi:flagellar biosynthetic protein FliQ [Donghicola sp. C2-DW-16]|uniref:Flagellar biosynthetic protein FliQ n=1 Tax=Donghicola mangrovi TaxID=2729614 RepID=A0A850Q0B7_9RHOB|nr:flagellar biosynthetic protein FliQ [Donghicola mangrovi]NVO22444.1 flagellar biosynthetic protein FliQ [Donghicola mangrovi]NVO25965.1 flagellar biosynthetic protein FliQ [Donghicola mangrovi]